jgi:GT2 family glycosyltransferase
MELSIVIVNWNTRELLDGCLQSLLANLDGFEAEIYVVDNASDDGSAEMIRVRYPQVQLIANQNNPGFAHANNQAIRRCSGRYLLLLNPDTVMKPGSLKLLYDFMEETPGAGAAGARLLNPDGSLQLSAYPEPTLWREFWRLFHLDKLRYYANYPIHRWNVKQPRAVDVLMGACLMISRQALDASGPFDEEYFMYSEEVDLCHRLRESGFSLYWVPEAQVIHFGGQSTQQAAEEMFLRLYQGKVIFFRKHHSWAAVQAYKFILFLASLGRLALTPLAYLEKPAQRRQHLDLSNNYLRLISALPGF